MKTDEEKLYQAYYEPDGLWTGGKAIKELHKITPMLIKDIKSWLTKQTLWQVHIPPPKEMHHPHYDVTRPNDQHQFDLLYIPHNLFEGNTYKYILTGINVASRYKVARPLRTKKSTKVAYVLEAIYKKGGVFKYPKTFQCDNGSEFKNEVTKLFEKHTLRFEEQQQNISTPIQPFWRLLTKSWQNCCLNQWIPKSFKTLKKYQQIGLKI